MGRQESGLRVAQYYPNGNLRRLHDLALANSKRSRVRLGVMSRPDARSL